MRLLRAAADPVTALGFSPDGRGLVVGHERDGLFAFDLTADRPPVRLGETGYAAYREVYFDPDGRTVYWWTPNGRAAADRFTGRLSEPGPADARDIRWLAQTADGRRVFAADYHQLLAWRAGPGGWAREWQVEPAGSFPGVPALDPTGERLAHLGFNGRPPRWPNYFRLDVRDAATGAVIGHGEYPYTRTECRLVFRPDGRQLVGLHAMSVLVWGVPNWGKPRVLRAATRKHVTAAAFDPAGRHLYAAGNDGAVAVWDAAGWERVRQFAWGVGPLKAVAVSPDGALAAAGAADGRVVVWDVEE